MFGLDIAAFTAIEMAENGDSGHRTKLPSRHVTKPMTKTIPAIRAASACIKPQRNSNMVRRGHVRAISSQPARLCWPRTGVLCRYLSGAEAGANFDYGTAGALSFSYMWTNEYKAPWHIEMDDFYQNDKKTKVDYLHSVGAKYDFKNDRCWRRHLVRLRAISISTLLKPATSLTSPARR